MRHVGDVHADLDVAIGEKADGHGVVDVLAARRIDAEDDVARAKIPTASSLGMVHVPAGVLPGGCFASIR
eukprot:scaffold1948_cov244-Pinguiococcus_pyrenoidosus.AAC.2